MLLFGFVLKQGKQLNASCSITLPVFSSGRLNMCFMLYTLMAMLPYAIYNLCDVFVCY